jgi:hypothetical protein
MQLVRGCIGKKGKVWVDGDAGETRQARQARGTLPAAETPADVLFPVDMGPGPRSGLSCSSNNAVWTKRCSSNSGPRKESREIGC